MRVLNCQTCLLNFLPCLSTRNQIILPSSAVVALMITFSYVVVLLSVSSLLLPLPTPLFQYKKNPPHKGKFLNLAPSVNIQ